MYTFQLPSVVIYGIKLCEKFKEYCWQIATLAQVADVNGSIIRIMPGPFTSKYCCYLPDFVFIYGIYFIIATLPI